MQAYKCNIQIQAEQIALIKQFKYFEYLQWLKKVLNSSVKISTKICNSKCIGFAINGKELFIHSIKCIQVSASKFMKFNLNILFTWLKHRLNMLLAHHSVI